MRKWLNLYCKKNQIAPFLHFPRRIPFFKILSAFSVWTNYINCWYMFIFVKNDLAHKGWGEFILSWMNHIALCDGIIMRKPRLDNWSRHMRKQFNAHCKEVMPQYWKANMGMFIQHLHTFIMFAYFLNAPFIEACHTDSIKIFIWIKSPGKVHHI